MNSLQWRELSILTVEAVRRISNSPYRVETLFGRSLVPVTDFVFGGLLKGRELPGLRVDSPAPSSLSGFASESGTLLR
jgi:hypothetical protein